jgi:outer membrane immunogenic protein
VLAHIESHPCDAPRVDRSETTIPVDLRKETCPSRLPNLRLATALAAAFVAASSVAAVAADLAVRTPYTTAPVLEPVINWWSGFYVGGQAGGASMSTSFKAANDVFDNQGLNPDRSIKFTRGGYGGFNWQSGSFVVGVDAQWFWYGNETTSNPFANFDFISTKLHDAGNLKVRFGLVFTDTLVYVAAGPAWANMSLSTSRSEINEDNLNANGSNKKTVSGLAVAAGVVGISYKFGPLF